MDFVASRSANRRKEVDVDVDVDVNAMKDESGSGSASSFEVRRFDLESRGPYLSARHLLKLGSLK